MSTDAENLWSRLMRDRIVFIGDEIPDAMANVIVAQLLFLDREDPDKDIEVYINSPGGSLAAGLAIFDTLQYVRPQIATTCVGMAAGISAVILSGGAKGKRVALANSHVTIDRGNASFSGTHSDIQRQALLVRSNVDRITRILAENCGKDAAQVASDIDRDYWMSPDEAVEYGIVDEVRQGSPRTE